MINNKREKRKKCDQWIKPWMELRNCSYYCTYEERYYKINYKYKRCKHTKTKDCCRNMSCSFICNFIFLFF